MWYHIGTNHSPRAVVKWLVSLWLHTNTCVYNIVIQRTLRGIYFIALAWRTMLILQNKGFHEFALTPLPRSLFNTLMVLPYSAFVSKLFLSNDFLILRSCMLANFLQVFFGSSRLNLPCLWNVQLHPTLPIFLSCNLLGCQLIEWANVFCFCFLQHIPPKTTT